MAASAVNKNLSKIKYCSKVICSDIVMSGFDQLSILYLMSILMMCKWVSSYIYQLFAEEFSLYKTSKISFNGNN